MLPPKIGLDTRPKETPREIPHLREGQRKASVEDERTDDLSNLTHYFSKVPESPACGKLTPLGRSSTLRSVMRSPPELSALRRHLIALVLGIALASSASGADSIRIERPWARATVPGQSVGAGYLTIINRGRSEDRLVAVSSPISREVQTHSMTLDGSVMRMRPIEGGLRIPAGSRVTLEPSGLHLMFVDLQSPLIAGSRFPVTLRFAVAGELRIEFRVESLGKSPNDAP